MSEIFDVRVNFPAFDKIAAHVKERIYLLLAATMQTNRRMIFQKRGAYNGRPGWAPLVFRDGMPLLDRGTLAQSMGPDNDGMNPGSGVKSEIMIAGNVISIGTNLAHARLMNDGTTKMPGGVMRPKNPNGVLAFPLPGGKKASQVTKDIRKKRSGSTQGRLFMFAKYVRIPARPFDDLTAQDAEEFAGTLENFIAEQINNG